jgi:hypothetical protein
VPFCCSRSETLWIEGQRSAALVSSEVPQKRDGSQIASSFTMHASTALRLRTKADVKIERAIPRWPRFVLPTVADVVFVAILIGYVYTPLSRGLLFDAGTGWHIRTGDHILATGAVPRADFFSYARAGDPWFAWEWLYDVLLSVIHGAAGLNGVLVWSVLLIAVTFHLLFRIAHKRSGSLVVAAALVILAGRASVVHYLARPHLASWLLTLLFVVGLEDIQDGRRRALVWLPLIMVLWVNMHGGFVLGLGLIAVYAAANCAVWVTSSNSSARLLARTIAARLGLLGALVLAATFVNPYGLNLHLHVAGYLSDSYLLHHIEEFASPDFHGAAAISFEILLAVAVLAIALSEQARSWRVLLLIAFSAHLALMAVRNLPISSILLVVAIAPALGNALKNASLKARLRGKPKSWACRTAEFDLRVSAVQAQLRGHALALTVAIGTMVIVASGGRLLSAPVLRAGFDPGHMPARAVDYLEQNAITSHVAVPDGWSGYLIYRMHPAIRLYMDDRHDFYGARYVADYIKLFYVDLGWKEVLDKYDIRWVLVPPKSPLANALKETAGWTIAHDDGVGIVFQRAGAQPAPSNLDAKLVNP